MENRRDCQVNQIFTVIKGHYLYIFRQFLLLYPVYLFFQRRNDTFRILSFAHHHNTFHHIVVSGTCHLSQTRLACFVDFRHMAHQYRISFYVFDNDISYFLRIINQTNSSYHISLGILFNDISSHIDIAIGNRLIKFQRRDSVCRQLVRVDTYFEGLDLSTETDNIRHSRHCPQIALHNPILQRFQFPYAPLVTCQRITVNFTGRTLQGLHVRFDSFGQIRIFQQIEHLLAGKLIIGVIVEEDRHHRQTEQGRAADIRLLLCRIHGYLDGNRDKLLYFLRTAPRPLRDNGHLRIGNIWKSIDRSLLETEDACNRQHCR